MNKKFIFMLFFTLLVGCGSNSNIGNLANGQIENGTVLESNNSEQIIGTEAPPTPSQTIIPIVTATPTTDSHNESSPLPTPSLQETNGIDNPTIGLGLSGISYWSSGFVFIDLMKQAEPGPISPTESAPSGSPSYSYIDLLETDWLDENGWPRHIPDDYYWTAIVCLNDEYSPTESGRYVLRYQGEGVIRLLSPANVVAQKRGQIIFDAPSDGCTIILSVSEIDPDGNGNYVRNISLVKEEYLAFHEAGLMFNPEWVSLVQDMRVLRFMDWQFTNGSDTVSWQNRPRPESASFGVISDFSADMGVPVEVMVALANQTGTDPWFNIPFKANDEYVRLFAEYIAANLDPELMAYFEYSNEVWNWIFPQTHEALSRGQTLFGDTVESDGVREYYGYRSARISQIVRNAFGSEQQRVHVTLATMTDDNNYPLQMAIDGAQIFATENLTSIGDLFDSVAVTWYFGIPVELESELVTWIDHYGDEVAQQMLFEQLSGAQQHFENISAQEQPSVLKTIEYIRLQQQIAAQYDLDVISYEGGTHLASFSELQSELAEFYISMNYDPRIVELYRQIYEGWSNTPDTTLFNHFVDVSAPSQYGSWGALRHLHDDTGRWRFLNEINGAMQNWEVRNPQAFQQGVIISGEGDDESLAGTVEEDFISGGPGDDVLRGGPKNDGLHGGSGNDTLYGDEGDDNLVGGMGSDHMFGGAGADRFIWTADANVTDIVHDFDSDDIIDLRGLFALGISLVDLDQYVSFIYDGADTVLVVDVDGDDALYLSEELCVFKGVHLSLNSFEVGRTLLLQ